MAAAEQQLCNCKTNGKDCRMRIFSSSREMDLDGRVVVYLYVLCVL